MVISFTTGKATVEPSNVVRDFLARFLPRMEREGGAMAASHFGRPEKGDNVSSE